MFTLDEGVLLCTQDKTHSVHLRSESQAHTVFIYLFIINLFLNLFLVALGLHCCAWALSICGERGPLFVAARALLIAVASLVAEHRL